MSKGKSATQLEFGLLLEQLRTIAALASAEILRHYHSGEVVVEHKSDGSPVSAADRAAEHIITAALGELTPFLPIIAEESYASGRRPEKLGSRFWLVDPLDGTVEFLKRNGEFTVNIALIDDGFPIAAVVDYPARKQQFFAVPGHGAFSWTPASGITSIKCRQAPAEGLVILLSRSHTDLQLTDKWLSQWLDHRPAASRRYLGSSVKFCEVASGLADCYPRLGVTYEWDTAAGQAILMAAGGRVETIDGKLLEYGKPEFINPSYVALGGM